MAELYAKPFQTIETGYNPQQTQQGGQDAEMQSYLESLPPEQRQAAIERINAPLTGEELAMMAQSGERQPTLEEYAEIEKFHKNHEISFIDGLGKIAEGGEQVMNDLSNAFASMINDPSGTASKMPATAVEAFAQGTRNFYGMLAQSQNPDSSLFKVKDFLNGTGTLEDRYNQYMEALKFNKQSAELAEGKQTIVMDKDMINHEVTQAMAYIADPTLFIPFGKVASTGLRAVGLGEKLTMAGARAAAIKNGIIGNTLKWGAGQPLEFLGGAVRNTIDYGLEKAGSAFEATTGIGAKEFAQTARMSGIGFSASAVAGHAVPYASTISDAYLVGSSARGFGEAITLVGDTMAKNKFGRGINSWAAEALDQAQKNGVALSPHAKGLLKTLNTVDPLFAYGWNGLETAAEGALIGGGLGYASGGAEGMYHGIGAGIALGAVGGTAGKVVADVTGGTGVARRAVQAKMVIEGHKVTNPEKAMFFQAMQKAAEARGQDVDLVNGIISGIDNVAPNFEFHALTPDQFAIEAIKKGYDPTTGKFVEVSALDSEFGGDRASKANAVRILRTVGGDFVGDRKAFLEAVKKASAKDSANPSKPASNIPLDARKYIDVAKTFEKLTKTQQEAVLKEIDGQGKLATELGSKAKLREHYDSVTWAESWTDSILKKFETNREGARKDIADMLAQETDKNGKLNRKGRTLADKLRAEGFLDRDNKLLRERNLLNADLTYSKFTDSKGAVISRESDGKTHMYINLDEMGSETFPHELFHTIMRESPMKKHFTDTIITKLLGTVDKNGNLVRPAEVNYSQVSKFFKKYIELTHRNEDGTLDVKASDLKVKDLETAIAEYRNAGENKKISDKARSLIENYTEEFGAYYFSHWLMGRNRNTLFFGGELKGIEGLVERAKDSFKDFWQSKISKANPEFDFSQGLNASFDRSNGLGRIASIDYYMRDMVRAASNANKEVFRPDSMTLDNLRDFERSNGLRNLTAQGGTRRLNPREQVTQNIKLGKEAYKILSGLDKTLRTSKDVLDENGKQIITGRMSEAELDALVKGGIVPRAWADKVNQGYAMLDGTVSNIFSAGYLGWTEQTTDASWPRLTGKDVAFKNRKAILFDVETKIKADGTFYTLFHTLDLAVIEQRGNHLWQNVDYRNLWNGDRASFEADFFKYISNASKASIDPKKLDSAALLETGDGNGAKRRDVLQQMAGMALQTGDAYKHQPIAVIPEGIRHSVTTFNIDGLTMPRVETGTRYDINMGNAHKFIRENWQPTEMKQEKTPSGTLMTHESGFKFSVLNGKASAYANDGSKIGTFSSIKEATTAAKNLYNKAQENIKKTADNFRRSEEEGRKNLQPLEEETYAEARQVGDIFKTKRLQQIIGNSKLVRQTFDEFLGQRVEEINSGKNEQEKGAILQQLFSSEFKELIDLEAELNKTYDEFGLEARQLNEQETEITKKIIELSQEKQRLKESGNPEANVDIGILDMYGRIYKRKEEVNKRMSEIANKMHNEGITDLNSHYYITKRFLQNFNETGKLSEEAVKFAITPRLIKEYESNFQTGKAVTFLANHGTPNHELMVSRTFDTSFLGRNTGSMSAFNATFFAGSKETSVNYVGNPIAKTWVRDFIQARQYYVKNFSPELKAKLESLLSSDTSKGVVQKVNALMANAHIEFPDDFKLKDTGRKTKEGEPIIKPQPETQLGYDIDGFLDRALESANDEGFSIGGYEMAWKEEGKKPYLLRNIVKMDNPYVHEYAKADYRDETFASVIKRAKEGGHDGVIFKNTKDGGGLDTIFASFAKNEDNKIFTLETTEDTQFAPRGVDEAGNKVKGGSEIEGRNYQPTEDVYSGGRKYDQNGKQWKAGFVGLYADNNPERVKGISLQFIKRADGSHRIRLTDNSKKGESADIGHITANIEGDRATLSTHINEDYRGKKLAYVVYSEMAERLRAMGVTAIDGQIVNPDGVPIKVREKIIGDTRDLNSGRRINYVEGANRIRDKQELMGKAAGVDVTNTLYKAGRYQPTEGTDWSKSIAEAQRDKPESAMVKVQHKLGGGLMSTIIEHSGDILHRTYQRININNGSFGYETVKYKVDLALRRISDLLLNKDEFRRNVVSDWANNKNSTGTSEQHLVDVKKLLKEFSDAHAELPANNELQRRVKALNVALGNLDFNSAHRELNFLRTKLVNEKTWTDFAKEGMKDENRPKFQPTEYQGGDDYYKPKKNKFESRDDEGLLIRKASIRDDDYHAGIEHNPESQSWYDIGHFGQGGTAAENKFELKNSGLWYWKDNKGVKTINPILEFDSPNFTHQDWFDKSFRYQDDMPGIYGRYEKPQYDKDGKLLKRGKISLTNTYRSPISDMTEAHFYKEAIASSLKVPASDIDAYWFGATDKAKRSMGLSPKDQLPIKFQPTEVEQGGRTYTDKQMSSEFIGRYASENAKTTKGIKPKFSIFSSGDEGNIELVKGQDTLGYINFSFSKATGDALIEYTRVADKHQGKGYGNLLYSELVERLRSMGMKEVQGMIIDERGRPKKIRERIIDTENARIGGDRTQIDYVDKDPNSGDTHTGVTSYLYNKAWYQPTEGEQGEPVRLSGKTKTISTKKVSTNQYKLGEGDRTYNTDSRQWTNGFIGRYAEENPILTKGIKLSMKNWDNRTDDYGRRSIELKDGNKLIGRIDYEVKKGSGGKWLLSDPTVRVWEQYRGKGYSNLLYSEMAERARFLGAEDFLQRIENEQALPMFAQVKTFGFGESKLIDADRGQYFPPTKENFDKLKKPLIDIQSKDGNVETVQGYEPWVHSWSKIFSDRHYQPTEGTNAPVNKENRNFILDNIKANANSLRAFEEGQKSPEERSQNYITIDNINPDLLRGEAVVMHSPDNAGVEPVQIGRFTVHPRGGMRYPSENSTQGWAGVKAGLGKQINENGNYNADKGYGWASAVGLIKGEYSKMKGTHIGLEVFLRNLQNFTDNNVLTEKQTIQILKNGLGDIGDTKRPLDAIVEDILAKSAKHEGKYTIDGRRVAIENMTKTKGSASLWKYLQSDLTRIEPYVKGFSSEGVTNANQFIKAILEPMYEAVSDPLTKHAKVGEVYGYLVFRSPVEEPKSNIHPSYKYSVQPVKGGSPVQLDILSTPMNARTAFRNRITAGEVSPLSEAEAGFKVLTGQKHIPTMRGTFMPSEYSEFKSEQSATGRILKNAKGYVIMMSGQKFRVYSPAKAIIGVYGSEEEAKRRVLKDAPKQ